MVLSHKIRLQQALETPLANLGSAISHISEYTVKLVIIKHFPVAIHLHFGAVGYHVEAKIVEIAQKSLVFVASGYRFTFKGLANGHFPVGRAIRAVLLVPFGPPKGRLAVYLVSKLGIELRSLRQKANIAHFGPGFVAIVARQVSVVVEGTKKGAIIALFNLGKQKIVFGAGNTSFSGRRSSRSRWNLQILDINGPNLLLVAIEIARHRKIPHRVINFDAFKAHMLHRDLIREIIWQDPLHNDV